MIFPDRSIMTIPFGADSTAARKRASACLREEMSMTEASTNVPVSRSTGFRPISTGISWPSFRSPNSSRPARREIANDLGESRDLAPVVSYGGEDHVGPEAGAVLAHAPTFVFHTSLRRRSLQQVLRPSAGYVLGCVEDRKMLADNLLGAVPLGALGAWVPRCHASGWIEHENRVVGDAIDELTIAGFALAQAGFRFLAQRPCEASGDEPGAGSG